MIEEARTSGKKGRKRMKLVYSKEYTYIHVHLKKIENKIDINQSKLKTWTFHFLTKELSTVG